MTQFAEQAKLVLAPLMTDDLEAYIDGIGEMFAEVEDFAREDADGNVPWSHLLDPEEVTTTAGLYWLAQLAGVKAPPGLELEPLRTVVELANGRRRGTLAYMVEVLQAQLTGTKTVYTVERYTDSAYRLQITTNSDETPDPDAALAAVMAVKPAGIVLTFNDVTGITWNSPIHQWNQATITWDASGGTTP